MTGIAINELAIDMYLTCGPTDSCLRLGKTLPLQLAVAFDTSADFWVDIERTWLESLQTATEVSV